MCSHRFWTYVDPYNRWSDCLCCFYLVKTKKVVPLRRPKRRVCLQCQTKTSFKKRLWLVLENGKMREKERLFRPSIASLPSTMYTPYGTCNQVIRNLTVVLCTHSPGFICTTYIPGDNVQVPSPSSVQQSYFLVGHVGCTIAQLHVVEICTGLCEHGQ